MSDKLLNDLFSRERLWAGLAKPTLSSSQNPQGCLRYNDQFYNLRSGLLGNQEFKYHSLTHGREGQGKLVDQFDVYAEGEGMPHRTSQPASQQGLRLFKNPELNRFADQLHGMLINIVNENIEVLRELNSMPEDLKKEAEITKIQNEIERLPKSVDVQHIQKRQRLNDQVSDLKDKMNPRYRELLEKLTDGIDSEKLVSALKQSLGITTDEQQKQKREEMLQLLKNEIKSANDVQNLIHQLVTLVSQMLNSNGLNNIVMLVHGFVSTLPSSEELFKKLMQSSNNPQESLSEEKPLSEDQPTLPDIEFGGGGSSDLMQALAFEKARLARLNTMYGGMRY